MVSMKTSPSFLRSTMLMNCPFLLAGFSPNGAFFIY
jgi:hypothetical protein